MITTWIIEHVGLPALKLGAIALAILGLIFGARKWGRNVEQVEVMQQQIKGANVRAKIDGTVNAGTNDDFLRAPAIR
jgi:hypothetical protein